MEIGCFCSRNVSSTAIFILAMYFTSKALVAEQFTKQVSREIEVEQGEFPFVVALLFSKRQECAGTLLSKTHTLTSCHCLLRDKWDRIIRSPHRLEDAKNVQVQAGTVDLGSTHGWTHRARNLRVHPKCARNMTSAEYDFGMITVEKPFVLWPFRIAFFSLPNFKQREVEGMLNGQNVPCISMGWVSNSEELPNRNLWKVKVVLQGSAWCREKVENHSLNEIDFPKFNSRFHVCAARYKLTPTVCKGDNGAPLMCGAGRRKELLALAAADLETNPCGNDFPLMYNRLDVAEKWIMGAIVASKSDALISNVVVMILIAQAVLKVGC